MLNCLTNTKLITHFLQISFLTKIILSSSKEIMLYAQSSLIVSFSCLHHFKLQWRILIRETTLSIFNQGESTPYLKLRIILNQLHNILLGMVKLPIDHERHDEENSGNTPRQYQGINPKPPDPPPARQKRKCHIRIQSFASTCTCISSMNHRIHVNLCFIKNGLTYSSTTIITRIIIPRLNNEK